MKIYIDKNVLLYTVYIAYKQYIFILYMLSKHPLNANEPRLAISDT